MLNKDQFFIQKELGTKILMIGVFFKKNAPGGMAAVIQYYEKYFECLRYFASWKPSNKFIKIYYLGSSFLGVLFTLLFDRKVKILHIHTAADASFWRKSLFVKLGKKFNKKVILHVHASRFKLFYKESDRKHNILHNLQLADRLVVLSKSWKEWFVSIGVEKDKIDILYNITDYPEIKNNTFKCRQSKVNFLFLGELGKRKGVFDLLEAIADNIEVLKESMELRIGGNTNEEKLLNFISTNKLDSFVKFEGWVSGEKKKDLLNWSDIYILPSFNEGLPIGILEAMSYKCAVISTPVGGIPEVVFNNENGTLVSPGNKSEIFLALKKYIDNPSLVIEEGNRSQKIVKNYLPESVFKSLKGIYLNLNDV